jgi:hypothetical protein
LEDEIMVVRLSGTQPQGPKHLETLENKTVDGTQNTVRVNRGVTANRPAFPVVGEFYYNTDKQAFEQYTSAGWFNIAQAPSAPTSVVATDQGSGRSYNDGQASVAFTPNSSGGAPSSFIVTPSPATSPATFTTTSSPVTVTGLSSSTQYTYTVSATGTYGTSAASAASAGVTATTVPQAPTINSATASTDGSGTATLLFTAGSTGGSAITSYTATSSPGQITASSASSPLTISGLQMDVPYTFTVFSSNANGSSQYSAPSSQVTPTIALGAFEAIASTRLTSNQAAITFSSIPQNYKHLQIRWAGATSGGDYLYLRSNIMPTKTSRIALLGTEFYNRANYDGDATYGSELWFGGIDVSEPAIGVIDILDYSSTTKIKQAKSLLVRPHSTGPYNSLISIINQFGTSTVAIDSITFQAKASYPLCTGTTVSLYGIKG